MTVLFLVGLEIRPGLCNTTQMHVEQDPLLCPPTASIGASIGANQAARAAARCGRAAPSELDAPLQVIPFPVYLALQAHE